MNQSFELDTAAAEEPVSLDEAKTQMRVDHSDEDELFTEWIGAATELVEEDSSRQLVTATWLLHRDRFPKGNQPIRINKPPVQSITAITYYDASGSLQTLDASKYRLDDTSAPGRVMLVNGQSWPVVESSRPKALTVQFVAGYGAPSAVPKRAKQAIKLLVGHWNEHREAVGMVPAEIALAYSRLIESLLWTKHALVEDDD